MSDPSWPLCTLCSEVLQGREEGGTLAEVETKAQSGNSSMVTRTETGGHRSADFTQCSPHHPILLK